MQIAALLFWLSLAFVAYTYVLYPAGIWLLSRLRPEEAANPGRVREWPSVTIVVAVYNEQQRVLAKIENLRSLDYEPDRLHFLFVSDGSTDATNDLIAGQQGVELLAYPKRRGKPHALNRPGTSRLRSSGIYRRATDA
jgi:cellulose synthase/poly-beta-1,6-N-acetylglucosamine synthase-like glycosyltransferase